MVLLDRFQPPLSSRRHWHAFYNAWATYLATDLNQKLPEGFFAETNVQFGIEIDVAAFEETEDLPVATSWQPPAPQQQILFAPVEAIVEVNILSDAAGSTLRSAIELVSPANKDRPEHRQAFLAKCETFLRQGISLVVVDVVTTRKANLHQELLNSLATYSSFAERLGTRIDPLTLNAQLYAAAYHPIHFAEQSKLDVWYETFDVGAVLPTMPLWLDVDLCVPLMLQETYEQTCRSQRITAN
jgi:Protein of unknown function (DUF4058)